MPNKFWCAFKPTGAQPGGHARHNKTVAVVMLPAAAQALPNPRQEVRADQQQREQQRLMRHQQLAIALLCAPPAQQTLQLQAAQAVVALVASTIAIVAIARSVVSRLI